MRSENRLARLVSIFHWRGDALAEREVWCKSSLHFGLRMKIEGKLIQAPIQALLA